MSDTSSRQSRVFASPTCQQYPTPLAAARPHPLIVPFLTFISTELFRICQSAPRTNCLADRDRTDYATEMSAFADLSQNSTRNIVADFSSHIDKQDNPVTADTKTRIILSIRPQYSEKIMDGSKTVELRRRFPMHISNRSLAYIYSTSPVRALVGTLEIEDVLKLPISVMWKQYGHYACIARADFDAYFSGLDEGFALEVGGVKPLPRSLGLTELRERFGFRPPQSFQYLRQELETALWNESPEVHY